jgi:hypothetical protein
MNQKDVNERVLLGPMIFFLTLIAIISFFLWFL